MSKRKLIEKKDWDYYIYETDDVYELSVPIAKPTPGFDVIYTLNRKEKNDYICQGVIILKERINDMKENFSKYKMNSWR